LFQKNPNIKNRAKTAFKSQASPAAASSASISAL
jgi:hypothetical protein